MTIKTTLCASVLALWASQAGAVSGGGFSLTIENRSEDYSGYVRLEHGALYSVCFNNTLDRRADAELTIDGLWMGKWRVNPNDPFCVERPFEDTGRFTFYRADSAEGYAVGSAQVARTEKGRVSVQFFPERIRPVAPPPPPPVYRAAPEADEGIVMYSPPPSPVPAPMPAPAPMQDYSAQSKMSAPTTQTLGAGVTGLSGESDQRFGTARRIKYDMANAVTLELRLVHDPAMDRPVDPRPLPGRYDRLAPPPVEPY